MSSVGTLLAHLDRFWMPSAPAVRPAMLRVLVGLYGTIYLWVRAPHLLSYALDDLDRFQPVGVVSLAPSPTLPVVYQLLVGATLVLSFAFLLGYRYRVTAPLYAGLLLWVLTYTNSWGKILHTDNLLVLYVVVLALSPAADALSLDARGRPLPDDAPKYGWVSKLMATLCVLVYVLAGLAKLRNSGMDFIAGETLRNYVAFGNVRKIELGSHYSPLGVWLLPYTDLFAALATVSLLLELGGPLALLHRRLGVAWAVSVWAFHLGVLLLMAIGFVFQLSFVAFTPFFRTERIAERWPFAHLVRLHSPRTRFGA